MTAKEQQELTNMAINYDNLSPTLKQIFVSQIGFGETIQNTSNASSHVGLLEEESREMVCERVDVKCNNCGNKTKILLLK